MRVKARSKVSLSASSAEVDRDTIFLTVMVIDTINSTKRVTEIEDRDWSASIDQHDRATCCQIAPLGILVRSRIHAAEILLKRCQISGVAVHLYLTRVGIRVGSATVSRACS
jgi:hypothetical protein